MMRQYINIVEARRPRAVAIDTSKFATDITQLMSQFQTLGIRFKRDWADAVTTRVREQAAREREGGNEDYFDAQDYLVDMADKFWQRAKDTFGAVRRNVEREEHEYQQRAAERHDRLDDLDFYIESSDYLSGMEAMKQCAIDISVRQGVTNPTDVKAIIDRCERFISAWEDSMHVTDGGEAPILDEDFVTGISMLLPLLWLTIAPPS